MTLKWNGDAIQADIKGAMVEGTYITAEQILTRAKQLCPRDTGTLRNSGTVTTDEPNPQEIYSQALTGDTDKPIDLNNEIKEFYVSFNTPYAHYQHELESAVNYTEDGTTYKYLEKAWNALIKNQERNIRKVGKTRGLM